MLLARIANRAGRPIRPAEIAGIDCSIYEVSSCRPHDFAVIAEQDAVALDVGETIFEGLQADDLWTVDKLGYNFRHAVALGENVVSPQTGGPIEVRYVFTPTIGERTFVRFQLKVV